MACSRPPCSGTATSSGLAPLGHQRLCDQHNQRALQELVASVVYRGHRVPGNDVIGGGQRGVDPAMPDAAVKVVLGGGEHEGERLPVGIDYTVEDHLLVG